MHMIMAGIAPLSWRLGVIRYTHYKWVFAVGPFRLSIHNLKN